MKFPKRNEVEQVRKEYPAGCRVELLWMKDAQAPPVGTLGTVTGVDDTGSILVDWDNGSGLHVVYEVDRCRRVPDDFTPQDYPGGWKLGDRCFLITNKARRYTTEYEIIRYDGEYFSVMNCTGMKRHYRVSPARMFRTRDEAVASLGNRAFHKKKVDALFEKMVGLRFVSYQSMEEWFRWQLKDTLPDLHITGCDGINAEIENGGMGLDYSTDCTFGEDCLGMKYADFTIDYILDNEKKMYVTYVRWN